MIAHCRFNESRSDPLVTVLTRKWGDFFRVSSWLGRKTKSHAAKRDSILLLIAAGAGTVIRMERRNITYVVRGMIDST